MASKEEIESKIYQLVGYSFNISSNKQLIKALYEDSKIPVIEKTSAGNPSTTESTLKKLANDYPIAQLILDYKIASKKNSSKEDEEDIKKTPKPGMPQPRQVLERPNVINELTLAPEEIIKAEEEKEVAKRKATVVFVAKDISEDEIKEETDSLSLKKLDENSADTINKEDQINTSENDTNEIKSDEVHNDVQIASQSNNSSFSIIKKTDNVNSRNKKKFDIDDNNVPENEFSKNSAVLNVKQNKVDEKNKETKSRFSLYIIGLIIILFSICIFLYINSVNSI